MRNPESFVTTSMLGIFLLLGLIHCPGNSLAQKTCLLEAEGFQSIGGWKVDQQYFDIMGSTYLLAHGMGEPVEDAVTSIALPAAGEYHVWVRTKDWAPFPVGPGKFTLRIGDGYSREFGSTGELGWKWYYGETVRIQSQDNIRVVLHDMTGFEGRCDAIYLTTSRKDLPPGSLDDMNTWRRELLGLTDQPTTAGGYDLVVVGGGIAGICAAVSAARSGIRVALVQNRPVLGGNNSSEIRVHLMGKVDQGNEYPVLGRIVRELDNGDPENANKDGSLYGDERKKSVVEMEPNIDLYLNMHAYELKMDGDRIRAVVARHISTNQELRFESRLFCDCTGDGTIGYLAGADFRIGRESRDMTGEPSAPEQADGFALGTSNLWHASPMEEDSGFPETPWALLFSEDYHIDAEKSEWWWETGYGNFDPIADAEEIRDHNFRAIYGNWSYLKNHKQEKYGKYKLDWVAYIGGKRESRKLMGDYILSEMDCTGQIPAQPDGFVTATWTIDLHYPDPENTKYFEGEEFIARTKQIRVEPFKIPYRCLYSRNIKNLYMAGRDISTTHVAFGATRVMRTCGMMGELVGIAAAMAIKYGTGPAGIYESHLDELRDILLGKQILKL